LLITILYEEDYEDCDVISVPDEIGQKIDLYAQQFCDWLASDSITDDYYITINGKRYVNLETDGFVKWINKYLCNDNQSSYIEAQHIKYSPKYKTIEF